MSRLSHVGEDGRATMVDVTGKAATDRTATASGWLRCLPETLARVRAGTTHAAPAITGCSRSPARMYSARITPR